MAVVGGLLKNSGQEYDRTFVRPETTVEIIDNSGNKSYKQVKDLSDQEREIFQNNRNIKGVAASPTGRTSNPLIFSVDDMVSKATPQIKVNSKGTGLVLTGTKSALDSDMGNELQGYLNKTFKYADLRSENVAKAIEQLNNDIRNQVEERVVDQGLGANYNDYKDYRVTMQQFQSTNPMKTTAAVPGYTRDGKKISVTDDGKKTIAEWLDYYQKNYSAKERAELYNRSRQAIADGNTDFALWTPYLVMSGGNMKDLSADPVYGFNAGERTLAGAEALLNEGSARLIEGLNQTLFRATGAVINTQGFMRRDNLKERAKRVLGTGSDITSNDIPWISEKAYKDKLDSIKDKSVRALTKDEKNFLAAALGDFSNQELDKAVKDSNAVSDILNYTSYNKYINSRDNLSTVEKYDEELNKVSEKGYQGRKWLQEDVDAAALYAPVETTVGSFAGTLMRMWAESGLISAATGGAFTPSAISDNIASKFLSMLSPTGNTLKALQTPVGSFFLSVAAELPEDVVQTVIDDMMTGRAGDIPLLAPTGDIDKDMEKLGESFAQNLAFRLAFTPIQSGAQAVKNWRAARKAVNAIDNDAVTNTFNKSAADSVKMRDALDNGEVVDVTGDSATVRMPDGTEQVIDNVAMLHFGEGELAERYPAIAEMLRKQGLTEEDVDVETARMYDDPDVMVERLTDRTKLPTQEEINDGVPIKKYFEDYAIKRIDDPDVTNKIIDDNIPQKVQFGYYGESGDIIKGWQGREVMAGAALRNPELRNAGLNKAYDVYYKLFPSDEKLSFEEWVNTPITLTRRFRAEEGVGSDNANVLGYSMRKEGLAEDLYGPETDTITIAPKYTTGLLMGADDVGFADEGEIFVPTALIESHPKYMTVEDIVGVKNAEGDANMDAVPSSASYKWESPDVTKTYSSAKDVFADMPTGKNLTDVKQWQKNAEAYFMNRYTENVMPKFNEAYPTVEAQQQFVRNMDYLFDLQRMDGETLEVDAGGGARTIEAYTKSSAKLDEEIKAQNAKVKNLESRAKSVEARRGQTAAIVDAYNEEAKFSAFRSKDVAASSKKAGYKFVEDNTPIEGVKNENGSLTRWLARSSDESDFENRIAQVPKEIRDIANNDSNFKRLVENYQEDVAYKRVGTDYPYSADRIDMSYANYLDAEKQASATANNTKLNAELAAEKQKLADLEKRKATAEKAETVVPSDYKISGSVIGKTYENEGIVYTVNEDDVRFYLDHIEPMMMGLREAGAAGQGKEAFTITGYLPHSDYDPTTLTAEDAMQQGVLWRSYTGASTTSDDGTFTTGWLDNDLANRYRTFANNMLWDSLGDEVIVSKYMEEFNADGLDVQANAVEKMVGGRRRLAHMVEQSDSVKNLIKNITGNGELPTDADIDANASKLGATDIVHGLYNPIYGDSGAPNQPKAVSLTSKSDWMRGLTTTDGSLYDNGGSMIVNGNADAKFLAKRIFEDFEEGDTSGVRQMFVDYLTQNRRRTAKGAEYVADKWMDRISKKAANGGITRRDLTAELGNLIYGEGANRVFRFIGRMDTSKLNASNRKALDSLLFRHSALSKVMNTSGFSAKLNKAVNGLVSARMKSIFWLNFKNGVLQTSECIRLFTEFKMGDALQTIKKLASDDAFRKEVAEWVDMLVPDTNYVKADTKAPIEALNDIANKSSYKNGTLTVDKMTSAEQKSIAKKFDEFANSPVQMGENTKNTVLMAGILQEAQRKGLSGNELFSYINQRFERIGLAANEMGRLNAADSPLFRIGANLKQFQIREINMWINNINDMNGNGEKVAYIIKNLGWKIGLTTVMAKLGYSATATLGIDPFDLMDDDYTGVDEEDYNDLDKAMTSWPAKLFLSGGFTKYISDLYWAARKAYEDNAEITEDVERAVDEDRNPFAEFAGLSFNQAIDAFTGFIPGYSTGKRVIQMNELLDTGWATSATGNKMYEAPSSPIDIAGGYLFGRSNTPNARAYYQTPDYLQGLMTGGIAGLGQQIGREFGEYRQFDPIDTKGYTDWFNGTAADEQQWRSGYYYFRNRMRQIQDEYQNALKSYTTDDQKTQLGTSYNNQIAEMEEQLGKFVDAYESKHPEGIDATKMKNLISILNTYQPVLDDTEEEAKQRSLDAYNEALYRYSQADLPAITSYKQTDKGAEVVYSPQLRSALQGEFGLPKEAANQIKQLYNDKWKDLGQQYRNKLFSTKGTKNKQAIQKEYINIVRQDLDPIVRLYGNNIWSNEDVENIIDDVFNSMIPKYGQSAKSYLKGIYKGYTGKIKYTEKGNETLSQVNKLLDQGKTAQAKALARALKQRVQENRTSLSRTELERLQKILND